jgi:hypothetical protein
MIGQWFFAIATIAIHTFMLWMMIWRETSLIMRWLSTALIARILCDYILLTPMDKITYFHLFYIFEIIGFILFGVAYIECKKLIIKSFIGQCMLIYLIPEMVHVSCYGLGFWEHRYWQTACNLSDALKPLYVGVLLYMCGILYRRKGNFYVN